MGALQEISVAAPAADRGSVMSAFFVVAYLSLSLPAIGAGITAMDVGVEPTFRVFGLGVATLALGLTLTAGRRTPSLARLDRGEKASVHAARPGVTLADA